MITLDDAMVALREAGLYVRQLDRGGFIGGSHIDASSGIRYVENSFLVTCSDSKCALHLLGEIVDVKSLEEAVDLILVKVKPGVDVPAPPNHSNLY